MHEILLGSVTLLTAGLLCAALIQLLWPLLERYALARPTARSSHTRPTPQGGGFAVMAAVGIIALVEASVGRLNLAPSLALALAAALALLALLGAWDDIRPLPAAPRLALQFLAAGAIVIALPSGFRVLPWLPAPIELAILVVGLVWFINLTNFMDGIDWITLVEVVPVSVGIVLLAVLTRSSGIDDAGALALALTGAMLGFAPFNQHVARLFLGDVGSLPIGALLGFLLIVVAGSGYLAAAIILPLYHVMDATVTLYRRWRRGEVLSQAHRTHFYQLATARGFTVPEVTNRIFMLNVILVLLALVTAEWRDLAVDLAALTVAVALTAGLLRHFERGREG